ncbi:MAG: aminotransferase [Alteromonadaceae bacterium]|nr:aminotransferase [Alteromonadaceae bacterium]
MSKKSVWQSDKDHVIHPYTDFSSFHEEGSQVISRAQGNYVYDDAGNRYLDGIAGLWCANVGHGNKEIADAIHQQILTMQYYNPFGHTTNEPASKLAEKLAELAPGDLNHVYYTTGGSCANDSAIRMIHYYNNLRGKPNKKKIISRNNGYHGSTYLTANLTGIHGTKFSFDRIAEDWVSHVSAPNMYRRPVGAEGLSESDYATFLANELENHILNLGADNVAAFIAEPVMGAGGVLVAPDGYHKKVADVCQKYDVLFVADEVVTAFGRLGEWAVSETLYDYVPDITIFAKGINSGYVPLGAAIISSRIYDVIGKPQCEHGVFSMGFTYTAHATACAAALKNIEIIEREQLLENVRELSPLFHAYAASLNALEYVGDVRGRGFMMGIEMVKDKESKESFPPDAQIAHKIYQACLKRGAIVRPIGDIIVLSPPLTFSKEELTSLIDTVKVSIEEVSTAL